MTNTMRIIKRVRLLAGLTQAQFAEIIGVSASAVKEWEAGRNGIRPDKIPTIRAFLEYRIGWDKSKIDESIDKLLDDKIAGND